MRSHRIAPAICAMALLVAPAAAHGQAYAPAPPEKPPMNEREAVNKVLRSSPDVPRSVARRGVSDRDLSQGVLVPGSSSSGGGRTGRHRGRSGFKAIGAKAVGDAPKVAARAGLGSSASAGGSGGGFAASAIVAALLAAAALAVVVAVRRRVAKR